MSLSRAIPHPVSGYIEVIFDGHEDWMSAVQTIEFVAELLDEHGVDRVLLNFEHVDMHIAVVEAPDVARLFNVFANRGLTLGIIRSSDGRGDPTIEALADGMRAFGHDIRYLDTHVEIEAWVDPRSKGIRRSG